MALVVETGAGLANAESYISVADATTYHAAMGNAAWSALASDTIREQLLRKATAYMVQAHQLKITGYRTVLTQALDLPRTYMTDSRKNINGWIYYVDFNTVPVEFKNACAILALKANTVTLLPDVKQQVISKTIAGAISKTYDSNSSPLTKYSEIESMLKPFFLNAGSQGFIHR